jgi:UDP-N-acetylmuramoyl-tripeptide--D-alanyl-D-alanine ligase
MSTVSGVRFLASEIAALLSGVLEGPDVEVTGAGIDSRELRPGELFVPIVAERDGHEFIDVALAAGAPAYLSARGARGATAVIVDDTAVALTKLGSAARDRLGPHVVGITGSVGKTTTKDLAAAAVSAALRVHASERSFNNELGVPLTLVNAPDDTEVTIVEMGARGMGHIAELCAVARPTIGVVTAVELVHTELFGDLASVAAAKAELIEALPASGTAILNADNALVAAMAGRTAADVLRYGFGDADIWADDVVIDSELRPAFRLHSPWGVADVRLAVRGAHNVSNALGAAAVALVVGADLASIVAGLQEATSSPWRMELDHTSSGAVVLNDAYNAGPASMEAALRALAQLDAGRRVAVLGVMAELGERSAEAHTRIATLGDELGIEIIAVDVPEYGGTLVPDIDAAVEVLGVLGPEDAVLVKGSRVAGLEKLAHALLDS